MTTEHLFSLHHLVCNDPQSFFCASLLIIKMFYFYIFILEFHIYLSEIVHNLVHSQPIPRKPNSGSGPALPSPPAGSGCWPRLHGSGHCNPHWSTDWSWTGKSSINNLCPKAPKVHCCILCFTKVYPTRYYN